MKNLSHIIVFLFVLLLYSCSGTKGLAPNENLFIGTKVKYKDSSHAKQGDLSEKVSEKLIRENTPGILNIKTGLYNIFKKGESGFRHIIKNKLGSKPVVFNRSMVQMTQNRLDNIYKEQGYFESSVTCDSISKNKRKVQIKCNTKLGQRYVIDSVFYIQDTLNIAQVLQPMYNIDFTRPGDFYDLANLKADRDQFVKMANNNGFPFVTNQDVVFFVDTVEHANHADIHMRLRPSDDDKKYARHRYGKIYINPNFSIETDNPTSTDEMDRWEDFYIKSGYNFLREDALQKAIFMEEGRIYDQKRSKISSDRLLDFGLFKFVNIKFKINKDRTIDQFINLITYPIKSITGEVEFNNRQGNYLGLAGETSFIHKNIFRGAERLDISLSGGLETQIGQQITSLSSIINTSDIKLEANLSMPNVVLPFKAFRTNRNFIPKTYISLSLNQEKRVSFYTVRALKGKYGFRWNETEYKESFFTPLDLSWVVLSKTSEKFEKILASDPRQAESFRTTLLMGSTYEYIFNKQDKYNPTNQSYFKGTIESAGNVLALFAKSNDPNESAKILKTPYSQYVRLTADARKYWAIAKKGSIATRLLVGAGFAYGNSNQLPYSKQYSIGGANSLRAFRLRSLGPGNFSTIFGDDSQFIDQTGDIKVEANIEYRFPLVGFFKGAAFVDAGNVWLRKSDIYPDAVFQFKNFTNQIAVGTGLGFRIDLSFLLLRLDVAFPIRSLDKTGKFTWVIDQLDFLNSTWRKEKLVFNIGVGYPF